MSEILPPPDDSEAGVRPWRRVYGARARAKVREKCRETGPNADYLGEWGHFWWVTLRSCGSKAPGNGAKLSDAKVDEFHLHPSLNDVCSALTGPGQAGWARWGWAPSPQEVVVRFLYSLPVPHLASEILCDKFREIYSGLDFDFPAGNGPANGPVALVPEDSVISTINEQAVDVVIPHRLGLLPTIEGNIGQRSVRAAEAYVNVRNRIQRRFELPTQAATKLNTHGMPYWLSLQFLEWPWRKIGTSKVDECLKPSEWLAIEGLKPWVEYTLTPAGIAWASLRERIGHTTPRPAALAYVEGLMQPILSADPSHPRQFMDIESKQFEIGEVIAAVGEVARRFPLLSGVQRSVYCGAFYGPSELGSPLPVALPPKAVWDRSYTQAMEPARQGFARKLAGFFGTDKDAVPHPGAVSNSYHAGTLDSVVRGHFDSDVSKIVVIDARCLSPHVHKPFGAQLVHEIPVLPGTLGPHCGPQALRNLSVSQHVGGIFVYVR